MFRVIEPNRENDYTLTIKGYQPQALRAKIINAMSAVISGESKDTRIVLPLYPQIHTILGQIRAMYPELEYKVTIDLDETLFGETVIIQIRRT